MVWAGGRAPPLAARRPPPLACPAPPAGGGACREPQNPGAGCRRAGTLPCGAGRGGAGSGRAGAGRGGATLGRHTPLILSLFMKRPSQPARETIQIRPNGSAISMSGAGCGAASTDSPPAKIKTAFEAKLPFFLRLHSLRCWVVYLLF
jgi:hypothetical protein